MEEWDISIGSVWFYPYLHRLLQCNVLGGRPFFDYPRGWGGGGGGGGGWGAILFLAWSVLSEFLWPIYYFFPFTTIFFLIFRAIIFPLKMIATLQWSTFDQHANPVINICGLTHYNTYNSNNNNNNNNNNVVSTLACAADDPGSIPDGGTEKENCCYSVLRMAL